jgi:hypothetical protein
MLSCASGRLCADCDSEVVPAQLLLDDWTRLPQITWTNYRFLFLVRSVLSSCTWNISLRRSCAEVNTQWPL